MLNCKQVTQLISKSFIQRLSIRERLSLWVHVGMCGTCRSFRRLQNKLHNTVRSKITESETDSENQLSETVRERMKAVVRSQLKDD